MTVRAIPGLKYELRKWETVSAVSSKPPYPVVASEIATGTTVTLIDAEPPKDRAFYKLGVER